MFLVYILFFNGIVSVRRINSAIGPHGAINTGNRFEWNLCGLG